MLLIDYSEASERLATLIFAHGAGAPMDSDFMNRLTAELNTQGIAVVRFEFPYMQERRDSGKKRPPDRQPKLLQCWREVYREVSERVSQDDNLPDLILLGGKSMGGRMATLIAEELGVAGVCCFGYPFHPPGKPEKLRTEHLETMDVPIRIVQGTRDPFGKPDELADVPLSPRVSIEWLESGDHDLKPLVRSGLLHSDHISTAASATARFAKLIHRNELTQ